MARAVWRSPEWQPLYDWAMHSSGDEELAEARELTATRWRSVRPRYRDCASILLLAFVLLLVVPPMAGVPAAAGFAALNTVFGLACIGGPKNWRAAFRGQRDPLWPIQRFWVLMVPVGGTATLVLGALALAGWR